MSRKEFQNKLKRPTIIQKKEASNQHWDSVYHYELKKKKQEENERKYALIIKFVIDEFSKRPPEIISKSETLTIIKDVLEKSNYISERFKRRRKRNLWYYTLCIKEKKILQGFNRW